MSPTFYRPSADDKRYPTNARIGIAALTKFAFDGIDLGPLWLGLLESIADNPANAAAAAMDMSVIAQLLGDQESGLMLQSGALSVERLYRSPCAAKTPELRLLAIATATDIGGNTPIEFLLEHSAIELQTLYITEGDPVPSELPAHDIAIVVAPASQSTSLSLHAIETCTQEWPRPLLNVPAKIAQLDRERLYELLKSIPGLLIPKTAQISRARLLAIGNGDVALREFFEGEEFPLIVRPVDSHAGRGLAKLQCSADMVQYAKERTERQFFLSPFVDYGSADGLFRKYRIVFVDGHPFACHMAISEQWKIWYLNAEMAQSPTKRAEEERFMASFDENFARRHRNALTQLTNRVGLEYFGIDCAETTSGDLLLFEADNVMIVHNMDPIETFPYKPPQMRKISRAFTAMLSKRAGRSLACAA
jgi:hypothetical protein